MDQKDPEIPLYHMAYLAARGPIETVVQNHQALRGYYPDPQWQDLAHQLNCIVSAEREDLIDLQASITFLRNKGKLHFSQQLVYWQLLLDSTMLAELAADMRQFPPEPATVGEVVWFVELAMKAGLTDIARAKRSGSKRPFMLAPSDSGCCSCRCSNPTSNGTNFVKWPSWCGRLLLNCRPSGFESLHGSKRGCGSAFRRR